MRRDIQWSRIFAEGTAIIVSILLAFAIDAWWQERKEVGAHQAQLQSLLGEFKGARYVLALQLGGLEESLDGTRKLLELIGPDATDDESPDFRVATVESLNVGVTTPQQGILRDVLASGNSIISDNPDLWLKLQTWSTLMGDLEVDGKHLESNREVNFINALIRLGVPMLDVIGGGDNESNPDSRLQLPPGNFKTDLTVLVHNPGVETVFTMRAIRSQILIGVHKKALQTADEIIGYLENGY